MKQEVMKIYTKPYLHAHYQSSTSRQKKQQQNDNGLQGRKIEHQLPTAVLQKWRCCASYDSFVVGSSAVLRLQFSGENRPPKIPPPAVTANAMRKIEYDNKIRKNIQSRNNMLRIFDFLYKRIYICKEICKIFT
jgi:hypothetical protein